MNCILFFPDKSVTVGLYLITMRWQIGRGFPFQPPSSFQLPASAKRFPWDLHPLSNYQLQHGKPAARNFVVFDSNVHFLPD